MDDDYSIQLEKQYFDEEIKRSFQNVNYSQWERRKSATDVRTSLVGPAVVNNAPKDSRGSKSANKIERKCSALCNHGEIVSLSKDVRVRKTKKQLLKEEENMKMLTVKIQNAKDAIQSYKMREIDLKESNLALQEFIEGTEKDAHDNVDDILRKYDKYRNVLTTMQKKHAKEMEERQKELKRIEKEIGIELPIHENRLKALEDELQSFQELYKLLSTYKNQEYPEKLLQIKTLQKELLDLHNVHAEEKEELVDMITKETNRITKIQIDAEKNIVQKIFDKSGDQMHHSLKDMAKYNETMKEERVFHSKMIDVLNKEIKELEDEIVVLLKDERRHTRRMVFPEFYKKQPICTPDMDVILNL